MTDVLLIQPPVRDFYLTAKRTLPYGLSLIAASLMRAGHSVEIFDAMAVAKSKIRPWPSEMAHLAPYYGKPDVSPFGLFHHFRHYGYSFEHIGQTVWQRKPFLVGISSLFTAYSDMALKTAEVVKASCPEAVVVLGGHHPTALPEAVMAAPSVDFVIRGEGEESLPRLVDALRGKGDLGGVPGLVRRRPDGTLHVSEPAAVADLDGLPLPAFHLVRSDYYRRKTGAQAVVTASRGCPMTCSYCVMGRHALPYRRRSVASVFQEIEAAVQKQGAGFIDFEDENLSLDRDWFLSLLERLARRFGPDRLELRAMNGLYAPSLDEAVLTAMKRAGFRELNLSMGTRSAEQLGRFNRPPAVRHVAQVLEQAAAMGLAAVTYIIVGAPRQSPETSVDDLLYLASLPTIVGVSVYYPAPGSADWALCRDLNLLPETPTLLRSAALPVSHATSRLQSATLLRLGRMLNFMKSLIADGMPLPEPPAPGKSPKIRTGASRRGIGTALLSWFLDDGVIRGVTPDGAVYRHAADATLCRRFLENIGMVRGIGGIGPDTGDMIPRAKGYLF